MYTEKFKQVVQCCKENNLFVGYGNPNGKVLVIGKEAAHVEGDIQQLKKAKERFCDINIKSWEEVLSENEVPNYDSENPVIERFEDIKKPQYGWGCQNNKVSKKLKSGEYNEGTSDTYTNYEKLYEQLFLQGEKLKKINFQKEFFITEFSDYPTKESYKNEDIEALRKQSIEERKRLFAMPFFKEFPIVIVAAGNYPSRYHINLEQTFDVVFQKEIKVERDRYFLHFSKDNKRILIHTRQLSNSFSKELIPAITAEAKKFL